ncbi:anthranilate phosphoribosyltransferase [Pseudoteredinibacter isoporae]|uniref:Anthranilate phosphoribosyltransferase n=1 Tax=Pseudoteredinibacter isoporae TaxID=570281 RepID=A0A7X0JSE2_9GAMM|nr:anthranilate phosphoribosyltransferase [Pseudoteredinibacter isoporae]MBB6520979.1 anthranilate phosphoribosyltransferase [Pseudoteredinibacter isoporae]NHO86544.1 anthranilate phosphoribosyltransferase [Pseudoteredinibacter isoporae]NIB25004.1 anthranilate phosphoribosyltransferase [Pseudoteredinibacter isoporae]
MNIQEALGIVIQRQDLTTEQMASVMRQIMTGQATEAQIGGFLVALRMKSESLDEITGAVQVMRELASEVKVNADNLVDIVGTGGDGANLFNISSAASFVVAAAGAHVAKHGNRSISSSSGSADVIETAGIRLDISPEQVARCTEEVGVGFMFAPAHHGAMKYSIVPRKQLAQRTIFNILGPMTNPAGVKRLVVGVFNGDLCRPMAEVLRRLGAEHVMVVNAKDGLDEISLATTTHVAELKNGEISEYEITPEDFDIDSQSLIGLTVDSAEESLALIRDALGKRKGQYAQKAADIVALNAGAAIYVSGLADTLAEGVARAQDTIASGLGKEKIAQLAEFTRCLD